MSLNPEFLIHVANVLYLFAFIVRDILWLRTLTVIASLILIPYFYLQQTPLMTPIYWNIVFTAINLYWIIRLLLERRPITLSDEEQRLCELVLRSMTPRKMIKIIKLGIWKTAKTGECFVERGAPLDQLMVIYSDKACAELDRKQIAELQPGQFIGGISYITEETAPTNVISLELVRYISWPKIGLKIFMSRTLNCTQHFRPHLPST